MRIAIVNDVPLVVEALRRIVLSDPRHQIAWTAEGGEQAVRLCRKDRPDVVLMDLQMPGMNGAEATRRIMQETPCAILVVTATISGNFPLVCEALGHGAFEAVRTPELGGRSPAEAGRELFSKLERVDRINRRLGIVKVPETPPTLPAVKREPASPTPSAAPPMPPPAARVAARAKASDGWRVRIHPPPPGPKANVQNPVPVLAIGASTGGPPALQTILSSLPSDLAAAVVIAQHIGTEFAEPLVQWLQLGCRLRVRLAQHGDSLQAGTVLLAGGDDHLVLTREGRLAYTADPVEYPYRPSVDCLFYTLSAYWPCPGVAVLLTGIGRDGAEGLLALKNSGWRTIAQDQATSVVYGMPQAAAQIGAAQRAVPLSEIAPSIVHELRRLKT